VTTADRLRKEGRKEGRVEGWKDIARNLLRSGMDLDFVAKNTSLPLTTIEKLKAEL
jgi:predicted transposase YdaD